MKIACIQQNHNPGNVGENRAKALKNAAKALEMNADIILFHEEMLVGYHPCFRELAEPVDGETTKAFRNLLSGTKAKIIYGLTESAKEGYYISAPVVTAQGVAANYRKTHLWWKDSGVRDETAGFLPGDSLTVFEHDGFRYGLLICYDGDFPEMFGAYAKRGCAGVFWMNNRENRGHLDRCMRGALDNSLIVATSCCCGFDERGRFSSGLSNIVDCDGTLLGELDGREGIVFADVIPKRAEILRACNPWYAGMRPELY